MKNLILGLVLLASVVSSAQDDFYQETTILHLQCSKQIEPKSRLIEICEVLLFNDHRAYFSLRYKGQREDIFRVIENHPVDSLRDARKLHLKKVGSASFGEFQSMDSGETGSATMIRDPSHNQIMSLSGQVDKTGEFSTASFQFVSFSHPFDR